MFIFYPPRPVIIDAKIVPAESTLVWRFTRFYGNPSADARAHCWTLSHWLSTLHSLPWLCVGDFNEILSHKEKPSANQRFKGQITTFWDVPLDCGLQDLGFERNPYTWNNNRDDAHLVLERVDRFVASPSWISLFPIMITYNIYSRVSDHVLIMLSNFTS